MKMKIKYERHKKSYVHNSKGGVVYTFVGDYPSLIICIQQFCYSFFQCCHLFPNLFILRDLGDERLSCVSS